MIYSVFIISWLELFLAWKKESFGNSPLTTQVEPLGGGTIEPSGGWFGDDATVNITAHPSSDFVFDGWSGDINGQDLSVPMVMNGPKQVTARFIFSQPAPGTQAGDVDGDGVITHNDAELAARSAVGKIRLDIAQFQKADVDSNGTINSRDVLMILRYAEGSISSFGIRVRGLPRDSSAVKKP